MATLAARADLVARFENDDEVIRLTDGTEAGAIDYDVVDEVLDDAEGEVNSYLATRVAIPVDTTGETVLAARLKSVVLDIAQYKLISRKGVVSEPKRMLHDNAILWLQNVSTGKAELPTAGPLSGPDTIDPVADWGTGEGSQSTSQRVFTRDAQKYV